jgi:hypothetical protein
MQKTRESLRFCEATVQWAGCIHYSTLQEWKHKHLDDMESCLPSVCAWLHKVYIAFEEEEELKLKLLVFLGAALFPLLIGLVAFNFAKIMSDACLQK